MKVFLGIIVFFMLLWYALKIFLRYGLPWLIARFVRKQAEKQSQYQQSSGIETEEGEIKLKTDTKQKPKDSTDFGEYVDFEDVKE